MATINNNAIPVFVILTCTLLFGGCADTNEEEAIMVDSLKTQIDKLQMEHDSLENLLKGDSVILGNWYYPSYDGRKLLKKGIQDPQNYIIDALKQQPELIPKEGVLGGSMQFVKVEVLSDEWIIAQYEDGHVMGKALFSYKLNNDGSITFSLIDSDQDD